MLTTCRHCGRIHARAFDCGRRPAARRKPRRSDGDRFRNTKEWQRRREEIRRRDLYMCAACKAAGRPETRALEVHHIVPLAREYGRRLDGGNLLTLCKPCHELAERGLLPRKWLAGVAEAAEAAKNGAAV